MSTTTDKVRRVNRGTEEVHVEGLGRHESRSNAAASGRRGARVRSGMWGMEGATRRYHAGGLGAKHFQLCTVCGSGCGARRCASPPNRAWARRGDHDEVGTRDRLMEHMTRGNADAREMREKKRRQSGRGDAAYVPMYHPRDPTSNVDWITKDRIPGGAAARGYLG